MNIRQREDLLENLEMKLEDGEFYLVRVKNDISKIGYSWPGFNLGMKRLKGKSFPVRCTNPRQNYILRGYERVDVNIPENIHHILIDTWGFVWRIDWMDSIIPLTRADNLKIATNNITFDLEEQAAIDIVYQAEAIARHAININPVGDNNVN